MSAPPSDATQTASSTGLAEESSAERATDDLAPGAHVSRYRIAGRIGAGGMGVVYAAHDAELERDVAIKLVQPRRGTAAGSQTQLVREAQAMARLSHPGVVPIYDVGTLGHAVFLAMELVDGVDARRWLADERPGWPRALGVLCGAGRGLAAAHAAGIVHRDVKLANILVGRDGRARITDFGLARTQPRPPHASAPPAAVGAADATVTGSADRDPDRTPRRTRSAGVAGTPAYMAPEQHVDRVADARSDQFSLCIALYIAVYGAHPFVASETAPAPEFAAAIAAGQVLPPPRARRAEASRVPGWLRRILLRGLAVAPEARWPSVDALIDAIEREPRRRRRWWWKAGAGALVAGALAAAFVASRSAPPGGDACGDGAAALAPVWTPAVAQLALARVAGLGDYGASLAPRLGRALDDHAARWIAVRRTACLAHRAGARSDAAFERSAACLARDRDALGEVAAILAAVRAAELPQTILAVRSLPEPEPCASVPPPPADSTYGSPPALAGRIAAIAGAVSRAEIEIAAARYDAGADIAHAAVADARTLGDRSVLAAALLAEGHAAMELTNGRSRAVPLLDEATAIAARIGDDSVAVEAWARRAWIAATAGDAGDLGPDARLIEGLAARPATRAFSRALLHNNLGGIALARGDAAAARPEFERALAEAAAVTGAGAVELLIARTNLALVSDAAARDKLLDDAVAERTRLLGPDHPSTLQARAMQGAYTPAPARAVERLAATCGDYARFEDTRASYALSCWTQLGYAADELGDRAQATTAMAHAARIHAAHGGSPADAGGYALLWQGHASDAVRRFTEDVAANAPRPGDPWWRQAQRGPLELGLARAQRAVGDLARARQTAAAARDDLAAVARSHPAVPTARLLSLAEAELAELVRLTAPQTRAVRDP